MEYHVIWDKGGVVFSDAVKRYTTYKNFHDFYPRNCGFFKSVLQEEYTFSSLTEFRNLCDSCKKKLKRYYRKTQIDDNDFVEFKSRFYTSDYVSILYTFYILASYDYSIIKYMSMAKKMLFWNYYFCPNNPEKIMFGSGLHRYLSDQQAVWILKDIVEIKQKGMSRKVCKFFVRLNFHTFALGFGTWN